MRAADVPGLGRGTRAGLYLSLSKPAAHLFSLIPGVFDDLELVRELTGDRERLTVLRARIGDQPADGMLDERYALNGRIEEVMIALRPYGAVKAALRHMQAALAASPERRD
jgi:hypothetical protein